MKASSNCMPVSIESIPIWLPRARLLARASPSFGLEARTFFLLLIFSPGNRGRITQLRLS
jgi:hypothetical protein